MASPPSKRLRRTIVVSSDDEDSTADSQLSNTSLNITTRSLSLKNDLQSQQRKSVKLKSKAPTKTKASKAKATLPKGTTITKNATIYSFFNNATPGGSQDTVKPRSPKQEDTALTPEDTIEDISSDSVGSKDPGVIPQQWRKGSKSNKQTTSNGKTVEPSAVTKSSQFSTAIRSASPQQTDTIQDIKFSGPWADIYPPESLDELVVHKRKVADVHRWLDNVVKGRERKRLLVLKGPSGSGKTATLRLLAREVGIRITEWENPVGSSVEEEGFVSLATQFDEFLTRTINFHGLELHENQEATSSAAQSPSGMMLLIEDFPNTFTRGSLALMNFRDSVLRYLVASTPAPGSRASDSRITPIVMIVTETHVTSSMNHSDSFTVGKLLGAQLLQHPSVTVIEFNPVAPTLLSKAITTVIRKAIRQQSSRWFATPDLIKKISQSGDIRSSVNSLQLAHLFEQGQSSHNQDLHPRSKKPSKKRSLTEKDQTSSSIDFRNDIIDLFHAVGKILYNKRKETDSETIIQPPIYLRHHFRPRESEVLIESLHEDIGSDIDTFISTLHENYALSCHGEDFADSLDDCIRHLSDSDLLLSSGSDASSTRTFGKHPPSSLQSAYAFHVASRGLLFSLPYPVERGKTMSAMQKLGRDPFRMVYPAALRLWRTIDEHETLIDEWNDTLLQNDGADGSTPASSDADAGAGACHRISRTDMVTQFLPYLAKIKPDLAMARSKGKPSYPSVGAGATSGFEAEDEPDTSGTPLLSLLTFPLPPPPIFAAKHPHGGGSGDVDGRFLHGASRTQLPAKEERLVLSDDDIEDD